MVFAIAMIIVAALTAATTVHSIVKLATPSMTSSNKACLAMMLLTQQKGKGIIVDLGAG